jgi:hypothetical protein
MILQSFNLKGKEKLLESIYSTERIKFDGASTFDNLKSSPEKNLRILSDRTPKVSAY